MNTKEFCDWFMKRDPDPQAALDYLANHRKYEIGRIPFEIEFDIVAALDIYKSYLAEPEAWDRDKFGWFKCKHCEFKDIEPHTYCPECGTHYKKFDFLLEDTMYEC